MKITVIVCTYNRCQMLSKALDSVARSILPESLAWEVLVVDNNSTDQTREVALDFCRRYPNCFRYLFEQRQGKSYALNSGVQEARGDIIAFMDDDVTVPSNWLQILTAPLLGGEWVGAGGRIVAERPIARPHWLPLQGPIDLGANLALFDLGQSAGELRQAPVGTNMAFRKDIFRKYGVFRTDLGPRPGSEIRHEDTEFGRRLLAAGERLWYEPSAIVYHAVPEHRLKKDYFLAFSFDSGRATIRTVEPDRRPDLWGIPRPYLTMLKHTIVLAPLSVLRWLLTLNPQKRFFRKSWVWYTAGEIAELYHRSFGADRHREDAPKIEIERNV